MSNEKEKYLIETYTDKYRSLYQAIMINLDMDKETNGRESRYARCQINPNLTILLLREYYDENMKLLRIEELNDDYYFEV